MIIKILILRYDEVSHISKSFSVSKRLKREIGLKGSTIEALKDVSFSCKPGRIFTLLGPNGAGKTTLLRLMATILEPTSGTIRIAGFDTIKDSMNVRKKIGFLTASSGLYERLTVNEIIQYFANLYSMDKMTFERRKRELYELLQIDFSEKKIGQLSTGMKQKVSLVRTMIHDPEVIVFDEPTAGLDVIAAKNIISLIKQCKELNKTIIFSSHIMSDVDLLSDDLVILSKGQICFNDSMDVFRAQMKTRNLTEEFIYYVENKTN